MTKKAPWFLIGLCLLLAGCEEGKDLSLKEAKSYLSAHERELLELKTKVEECQPEFTQKGVYNAIRIRDRPSDDPVCKAGSAMSVSTIKYSMKKLGVVVLSFKMETNAKISRMDFCVFSAGLTVSGTDTSIVYIAAPDTLQESNTSKYKLLPLESRPSTWYWQRWDT